MGMASEVWNKLSKHKVYSKLHAEFDIRNFSNSRDLCVHTDKLMDMNRKKYSTPHSACFHYIQKILKYLIDSHSQFN